MKRLFHTTRDVLSRQGMTVPQGSRIHVTKVLKRSYRGVWSSMWGSYTVTVPKAACRRASP